MKTTEKEKAKFRLGRKLFLCQLREMMNDGKVIEMTVKLLMGKKAIVSVLSEKHPQLIFSLVTDPCYRDSSIVFVIAEDAWFGKPLLFPVVVLREYWKVWNSYFGEKKRRIEFMKSWLRATNV